MLNIEIHGLPQKDAKALRSKIFTLFGNDTYYYVINPVVTICRTEVKDEDGNSQPFLRLFNRGHVSNIENLAILEALMTLGMDIEQVSLKTFVSAQKVST